MGLIKDLKSSRYATTLIFFVNGLVLGIWATNIPAISKALSLTDGQLGNALSMFAAGTILMIFMAGSVANKLGSRASIVLGGVLLSISLPLLVMSPSYEVFFGILLFFGICNSVIDISMNTHASIIEEQEGRPLMSWFHAAFSFGGMAGAGIVSIFDAYALTAMFNLAVAAALMLGTTVLCAGPLRHLRPQGATESVKKKAIIRPSLTLLIVAMLTIMSLFTESSMINWSAKYLTDVASTSTGIAAFAFGGFSFAMAVGRLAGNPLIIRFGRDCVLVSSGLLGVAGFALAIGAPSPATSIAGFMLVGLGLSNMTPILYSKAAQACPQAPSLGLAMNGTIGYLGFLVCPPIIGATSDHIGLQYSMLLPLVAMLVVSLVAWKGQLEMRTTAKPLAN
ncbi:MAG: MFS transporter [Pseudomonas farsensis]|uniref:MFS transporter n=1 Tax=Pseudomonas farsensis TaxID=2745492 RepID=UPI003C7D6646